MAQWKNDNMLMQESSLADITLGMKMVSLTLKFLINT